MASAETRRRLYSRSIDSEDWYLWDNYGYIEGDRIHIHVQTADRRMCASPEDRYWVAYWRHFVSFDGGASWRDEGPSLTPNRRKGSPDGSAIWSGSVIKRADGRVVAAYTGLAKGKLALQSICMAVSEDGYAFRRISPARPLLSAILDYDELIAKGYYLGPKSTLGDVEREDDGTFLCLRDPFLFEDTDGTTHLFFGSKARTPAGIIRSVGHAVFTDGERMHAISIHAPQLVPDGHGFNQLELPNVFRRGNVYYLLLSTTNLDYIGQPDTEASKSVRMYRSDSVDGGWEPYGDAGRHVILGPDSRLYGLNVLQDRRRSGPLVCRAFRVGDSGIPPSFELHVSGEWPVLVRPAVLWASAASEMPTPDLPR